MKIGVCGGTFDPFHRGHLDPVLAIRNDMQWDRVIYVPAWRQPFKTGRESASGYHRFAMAALAIRENRLLYVSPLELERGGTSYTVDTLKALHILYPGSTFDWIVGDDNESQLLSWRDPDTLFALARFVVLARGGPAPSPELVERVAAGRIIYVQNEAVLISSSEIRKRVRAGQTIDTLVDPYVSRYIQHYGLYKEAT
jgi:nicotinate-nucleotide adenylyltransferase